MWLCARRSMSVYRSVCISQGADAVLREFPQHSWPQVQDMLHVASSSATQFAALSVQERAGMVLSLGRVLENRVEDLAALAATEMGKPITQARAEVLKCAGLCAHYAEHGEDMLHPNVVPTDAGKSYFLLQPLGPIFSIFPWNFPFWQSIRAVVPGLILGNVFLTKHAPNVPQCALAILDAFKEAGFPEGVYQNAFVDNDMAAQIIQHDAIQAVTFTGSTAGGAKVASLAGAAIKKTVLELGGSDPFVVLEDADVDLAVQQAVTARLQNCGQSCIASKRFIVHEKVFETFRDALAIQFQAKVVGDPLDDKTEIGPLAREDLLVEMERQLQDSIAAGASIVCGGKRVHDTAPFFAPTILEGVRPGMPCFDEEVFGPVLSLIKVQSEEEALELANQSEYGLGGCVFTRDTERGEQFALQLRSGMAFVNGMSKSDARLPFGGIKKSGYGRECSGLAIAELANIKTVWIK